MIRFSRRPATPRGAPAWSGIGSRVAGFLAGAHPAGREMVVATRTAYATCPKVLVVDDSAEHRMAACAQLQGWGIAPILATDGAEAVALTRARRFDIILMDLQMPVLDGLGAARQIRRCELEHARPRVPVVAYTSAPISQSLLGACGIDAVLEKPCSAAALEACLKRWCS